MKRLIGVCTFLVMTMAAGGYGLAAQAGDGPGRDVPAGEFPSGPCPAEAMHRGDGFDVMAKVLRLSRDQQRRINDLRNADFAQQKSLSEKLRENGKQLREKTQAATFDAAAVKALAERQARLITERLIAPAILRHKIRDVLTPEQRDLEERIQPLLEQRFEHRPPLRGGDFPQHMADQRGHRPDFPGNDFPPPMK